MTLIDPSATTPNPSLGPRSGEARSRRRRRAQLLVPQDSEGRATLMASLARRSYPTYELFVYAALCGAILGLGFFLDSQALLVFGALIAPLLLPWIGLLLATITGSMRFFFETLMALLVAAALIFFIGVLSGFASRPFLPRTFNEAFIHSRLWWPDLLILALGAVILTVSFIRSETRPFLPSVILAYELFLPLSAGGFGLGSGLSEVWPHGLLIFFVNFAWASMFGLLTLVAMRFMPTSAAAFIFSAGVAFILVVVLVVLMTGGIWTPSTVSQPRASILTPAAAPGQPGTSAQVLPVGSSPTPEIETPTPPAQLLTTPAASTVAATLTATITMTFEPTPVYAQVLTDRGGAVLRETPGGKGILTLDNFTYVELLPETQNYSGYTWIHVIAIQNGNQLEGWVVDSSLVTATPGVLSTPAIAATATALP